MADTITPSTFDEVAEALAVAAADPHPVRVTSGSTKLGWGGAVARNAARMQMVALSRMVQHDPAHLTATLEAGMPLARAQRQLAQRGQRLALDPAGIEAGDRGPTIGGIFSTGDCGPLQHHYGAPRDLVLSARVALSDGTIAELDRALAQLFVGSFGTLGVLLSVTVRLDPTGGATQTALGASDDPARLTEVVGQLAAADLGLECLDLAWRGGLGGILAQAAGSGAAAACATAAEMMRGGGLSQVEVRADDSALWARERAGQRSVDRAVVRVAGQPASLDQLLELADRCGATVVSRAALGISYLTLNVNQIAPLRAALPSGSSTVVLDVPVAARGVVDPWGEPEPQRLAVMRAIKHQFDPAGVCNPGIFVGGI